MSGGFSRLALAITAAAAALLFGAPLVAFGVVPLFVRSTLREAAPPPAAAARPLSTSPSQAPTPTPPPPLSGRLRRLDPVHYGSGLVTIVESGGGRYLRFEDVDIAGAPNMFVYLSDRDDGQPGRYTDLGALKATNGSFNYALPADLDLRQVRSVVVWCRAFSVTVTFAPLAQA
jgi:hypothetical protein